MELKAELTSKNKRTHIHHDTGLSWLLIMLVLVSLALAINIFGNTTDVSTEGTISTSPTQTLGRQSRMYVVSYKGSVFSPTNLRIHAGDTVRFYNDSFFPIHIVSDVNYTQEDFAGFDSVGDIPPGSSFSFTFTVKGTFGYNNGKNVNEAGTIIVR